MFIVSIHSHVSKNMSGTRLPRMLSYIGVSLGGQSFAQLTAGSQALQGCPQGAGVSWWYKQSVMLVF